jgi:ribosomal protein S18 acetylase RimI-like enzyme/predicted nucleic acid-binding protein
MWRSWRSVEAGRGLPSARVTSPGLRGAAVLRTRLSRRADGRKFEDAVSRALARATGYRRLANSIGRLDKDSTQGSVGMPYQYFIRRRFADVEPFLNAVSSQADSERTALGFLPGPAYAESARQGKLMVLLATDGQATEYAGHLLFGGVFPQLRVRQICVSPKHRRLGHATTLLRALKSHGEAEGYLSVIANVATDLQSANSFYEKSGFATQRLKAGGRTRNRTINVKTLPLQSPNLISLMASPAASVTADLIQPKKRSVETPLYAIDLNVFFDAIRERPRSDHAGVLFEAALRHQIKIAASDEFVRELERKSHDPRKDPTLALARRIPNLPLQERSAIEQLTIEVTKAVFPEAPSTGRRTESNKSDVLHLCHAISAGAAGYITSDAKILAARDALMAKFDLDVIALSEFVELLDLPTNQEITSTKATRNFRISKPTAREIEAFLKMENLIFDTFIQPGSISTSDNICVSDNDGIIGVSTLVLSQAIDQPSRSVVCVSQYHPFSSTVADFLISEQLRICSRKTACSIIMLDGPNHPITRRMAISNGFQSGGGTTLNKVALGAPVTKRSWNRARLSIERLCGLKLEDRNPQYDKPVIKITTPDGTKSSISLFDLETLLSPTLFALPKRDAVNVPITSEFANALLGTDSQYSFLEVPEAQFLSRRTYFNTIRASRAMIRGSVIAFYESARSKGRGAIVALGRIVEVTSVAVEDVPEFMQRGAVVDDPAKLTKSKRVLVTQFDNLMPLKLPVTLQRLRRIGCVSKSNFVSATPISSTHLEEIVLAGYPDD